MRDIPNETESTFIKKWSVRWIKARGVKNAYPSPLVVSRHIELLPKTVVKRNMKGDWVGYKMKSTPRMKYQILKVLRKTLTVWLERFTKSRMGLKT